ncbi:beta-ketoacyl synthase chain length factor [uncultured Campylobacter sp.]|uniref:beta-ketoacyl synthase chain length factor n=1 Tax=uncultured Campylobacter sp. TaxID=218934 RepID=UPI00261253F4|nr:beta-ketoacyl synthase chain length factor [uncultured Campylobacter sp.]
MQNKLSFGVAYASAIISGEPAEFYKNFAACSDGISEVNLGGNSDLACDANQNFTYDFTLNSTQDFTDISDCEQNFINSANFAACENNEKAGRNLATEDFDEKSTELDSQRGLNYKADASKFSSARTFDCSSEEAAELYKNLAAREGEALQNSSEENLEISAHARLKDEISALEALKKKPSLAHIPPLQRRRLGLGAKLCISLLGEISQNALQSLAEENSLNLAPQNLDASESRAAAQNPSPQDFSNKNSLNFMPQNLDSAQQDFTNENSLNSTRQNFKTNERSETCDHAMQSSATQRKGLPLVFCSRLGEINRCFSLLGSMEESVSPSSFCVSVLNAIAAQNTIFTQNHAEISTISAACALENGAIIAAARLKEGAENSGSAQDANEDDKNDACKSNNDKIALLCYFEEANNDYLRRCDFACALLLVLQRGDDVQIEISPHVADATAQSIEAQNPKSRAENEILRSFKESDEIPLDTAVEFLAKILSGKREWRSSDGVLDYLWRVKDPAKIAAFLRQDRER